MKTITLIGMMGSGKTTIGKMLGIKLNIPSIDIDALIEKQEKKTITEIFSKHGENYFRNLEKETIKNTFNSQNNILSLGGGAFENSETRDLLLKNSTVIYLKTAPETILNRIQNNTQRPLLKNNMTIEKIQQIINQRKQNYESAHHIVSTDKKNPDQIIEEILGVL